MNNYSHDEEVRIVSQSNRWSPGRPEAARLTSMSVFFKVLADETRLKILFTLLESGKCVMHISEHVGMSQSAVSHQLSILRRADLVKVSRNGKNQVYSIADEHVRLVLDMAHLHICEKFGN